MIVGGLIAILAPAISGLAITLTVGWILVCAGIAHLICAFYQKGAGAVTWQVILALAYAAIGIYMIARPVVTLASLTILLGSFLFVEALLEFVLSYELRNIRGWGWFLFDGIVTLILACLIMAAWPWSSSWAIGTMIGVSILFSGFARLSLAMIDKLV